MRYASARSGDRWLSAVARMRPGVTLEAAQADLLNVTRRLESEYPATNRERSADLVPLRDYYLGTTRMLLLVVLGAVGLALVLCGIGRYGVMAFFVASRRPEIAVRMALGAKRAQGRLTGLDRAERFAQSRPLFRD